MHQRTYERKNRRTEREREKSEFKENIVRERRRNKEMRGRLKEREQKNR